MGLNTTTSKSLMRVLLINALSSTMALDASAPDALSPAASSVTSGSSGLYGMVLGFVFTILCLMVGFAWVTRTRALKSALMMSFGLQYTMVHRVLMIQQVHIDDADVHLENIMRETKRLLDRRMARLRQEM